MKHNVSSYTVLVSDFHRHGGGHCVYVRTLAKHLLRMGHRPLVASPAGSQLEKDCRDVGIEVLNGFRFDGGFTPISFCKDVAAANRARDKYQIDVIRVSGSRDRWVMAAANSLSDHRSPLIRTRHDTNPVRNTIVNRILNRNLTHRTISVRQYVKEMGFLLKEHCGYYERALEEFRRNEGE